MAVVDISSVDACPDQLLNQMWIFLSDYGYIFASAVIMVGAYLNLFGTRYNKVTLFIIAFFTGAILTFVSSVI
jgi:hypothetical protein